MCQSLTRVSLSRNSRGEMTQSFLARAGEMNFRVSFSSRFSRVFGKISLSPLDFRDSWEKIPFLFSIFKTLEKNFSFSSRLARFWSHISLSPLDYWPLSLSFQFPTGFRLHSNSVSHKNCRKENICLQMPKCAILALLGSPTLEM